jgi:repressor LexA
LVGKVNKLSPRQQKILDYICRYCQDTSYPPSIRDIVAGCQISSTSVVSYNLDVLEREGYIRRHTDVARGIEVLDRQLMPGMSVAVPVIGQIAAGEPIPVPDENVWHANAGAEVIEVTRDLTLGREGVYALRLRGWSMIDALVNDGDVVLLENVSSVENGEVAAVWLKAEKEATLKKYYAEDGRIRLQPANREMQPLYVSPDNVEVQGRVIAVIRRMI